jgi:hypothetical protein
MRIAPLCSIALLFSASTATAETPKGSYQFIPSSSPGVKQLDPEIQAAGGLQTSGVIYLNRCATAADCTFTPGFPNSSQQNRSSIVDSTSTVQAFAHGDAAWEAVVQCVQELYAPFAVEITDVNPGDAPHHEAVVGGYPQDIGMQNGIGGVAPFTCGIIQNSVTFSFANVYNSAVEICHTVAQETAHAFGLDHEFMCEDPMTYLNGCGRKFFQDVDAPCGEFEARNCQCGGTTQNSVERIAAVFGDGVVTPPDVSITDPAEGAQVVPGFPIRANVIDNIGIDRVEFYLNGTKIGETSQFPFVFNAPQTISSGAIEIEVRGYNPIGGIGSAVVNVLHGDPCGGNSDCADGEVCWDGACVKGPGADGGLGATCGGNTDCDSGFCGSDGSDNFCTADCKAGDSCPGGFDCVSAGERKFCWPGEGGLCSASGVSDGPLLPVVAGMLVAVLLGWRRRRRA